MQVLKLKYLSQHDLLNCNVEDYEIIDIIEKTMQLYGEGKGFNPPKPSIYPRDDGFINAMPASIPYLGIAGIKWISVFSSNFKKKLPACLGLIILNNAETGQPIAIMDASYITAIRTAAVSAVTCKYLANKQIASIGIIGTGTQAYYHALFLQKIFKNLKKISIYTESRERFERIANYIQNKTKLTVAANNSIKELMSNNLVVIPTTGHLPKVVYDPTWVKPGTLVLPIQVRSGWPKDTLIKFDKFITDDLKQFKSSLFGENKSYTELPEHSYELGEILANPKNFIIKPNETIIVYNVGIAINDIALANKFYILSRKLKLGQDLELQNVMDSALDFFDLY